MKHLNFLKRAFFALLILCSNIAWAQKFEVDGIFYNITDATAKTVEVTYKGNSYSEYNEYSGSVIVPSTVTYNSVAYSVTSIGGYAFYGCDGLTNITIPNSITSIRDCAFEDCTSLTSVEIPNSVTSIGVAAFADCTGLTSVEIPNSVTSIGYRAFYRTAWYNNKPDGVVYASKVLYKYKGTMPENTSITIKEGTIEIARSAFTGCSGLASIEIPSSVTSIGESAFSGCSGLTSIEIPSSVTSIGGSAFNYCTGLTSITIPNSVTSIGDCAFSNCTSLTNITIPNSVTIIGWSAFSGCSGLTSVEIPNSVTSIGDSAFSGCDGLTNITIPNSVTTIGWYAFSGCSGLTSVEIPNSVTSIRKCAFDGTAWYNNQPDGVVYAGKVLYKYKGTMPENTSITIKEGTLSISEYAFEDCTGLTNITIPNSVTTIGWYAFSGCSGLTCIEIPSSVTSIEWSAFSGCDGLTNITIPNSVTSIGESAFSGCDGLTNITIPNSVTSIGRYAFSNCTSLTSVTIPNSVTTIGDFAFWDCSGLTSIKIPNSVTSIGFNAFDGTAWYNNQPDGMVYAGKVLYAYKGTMPENTSIAIKEGTIEIACNAFQICTGLVSVTIPSSVTGIGENAFLGCSSLKEIYSLAEKPAAIQYDAFDDYSATLYVPYGAKEIYASVDDWSNFANIEEIKPEDVTITIGEYGSATYCSEFALDFSTVEGLKAYAATGYNTNTQVVTLTRVQTSKEATGLFLVAEPGEYTVPVIESSADYTLNLLVGVLEQTEVNGASADGNYYNYKYTVAETSDTPQFYQFEDGSSLSAGKAYLQLPASLFPATIAKAISLRFDKGATTDIDEIEGDSVTSDAIYFDLNGRRVENPTNGIYIVNGKKVFVNNK